MCVQPTALLILKAWVDNPGFFIDMEGEWEEKN